MTVHHHAMLFNPYSPCTYKVPLQFAHIAGPFKTVLCDRTRAELERPVDRVRYYVRDTVLTGLCLMVTRRQRKSGKLHRTYHLNCSIDGRSRRLHSGETDNASLVQARKKAKVLAGQVESGTDPMPEKRDKRQLRWASAEAGSSRQRGHLSTGHGPVHHANSERRIRAGTF